ncbi:MAG: hypothetical protein AAGG07_10220 [Planctomycetota bacterium]
MHRSSFPAVAAAAAFAGSAHAALIEYDGSFDEATDTISGDYRELGGDEDVGQFRLLEGTNRFFGGIVTPGDPGDTFNILLNDRQTLTAVRVSFDLDRDPFNPIAINQNTTLGVFDIDSTDPLRVSLSLSSAGDFASPDGFSLAGEDEFNILISSEVLALNDAGPVRYQIEFDVDEVPIPAPATAGLLAAGALVGGRRRR